MVSGQGNRLHVFLQMIKFEHSIFALPFAYLGLILAEKGLPRLSLFLGVTLAMVTFRTMAMGLNRLIDQTIDGLNPRTETRALPAGRLSRPYVWLWCIVSFAAFETAALFLGPLCFKLSAVPVFLAILYPYTKRFTWLSHAVLGSVLAIAPYGAWIASRAEFSWIPGLMSLGVLCWVAGFDIIYALQDITFDRAIGLYSFPAKFGMEQSLRITQGLHALTIIFWMSAGYLARLGGIYFAGLAAVVFFLVREHWLVRSFGMKKIEEAFFSMNAIVSVSIFAAVVADLWLWRF
jgi:4-hydroxybenzoate polyprenyltransferase